MAATHQEEGYLEGRLMGLNQLVGILNEVLKSEKEPSSSAIVKSIVGHISREMDDIITEMRTRHGDLPALERAEKKVSTMREEIEAAEELRPLKKHVEGADVLMKELLMTKKKAERSQE